MRKRRYFGGALVGLGVLTTVGGIWILTLPPAPARDTLPSRVPQEEIDAMLAALTPPKRARPLIAIVGINDETETTDYLVPYGILKRAGVADVVAVSTEPGPVDLYPALKVLPDATVADFDAQHPEGADYVIVPAMSRDDDPAVLAWIRSQADNGATVFGVCAGAKVVGQAGLLDGKKATTHWYFLDDLRDQSPSAVYVPDRRVVVDGRVATTTGVTASIPAMLFLIEAIAGGEKARAVAREVGLPDWDASHASDAFLFTRPFALTVLGNVLRFWERDEIGIELTPGIDEMTLALVADAWSRTYRSRAVTQASTFEPVTTANGLRVVPDEVAAERSGPPTQSAIDRKPTEALEEALQAIADRYGMPTAEVVRMQLEYPAQPRLTSTALSAASPAQRPR